jgi:hypothetical protein
VKGNVKSWIAIVMGIVILVADIIWTYQSTFDTLWLALGIIIFIADIIWLLIDYDLMKKN